MEPDEIFLSFRGMKKNVLILFPVLIFFALQVIGQSEVRGKSEWVYLNDGGKLVYKPTEKGDRIMDFSYAGYGGGGVSIPMVETKVVVGPQEGDNTGAIQHAIDEVSRLPLVNGFRGAVLLRPGEYSCGGTITIQASGVVLRGSGAGAEGSIIKMTGKPHLCIDVKGRVVTNTIGKPVALADVYVPSGAVRSEERRVGKEC